MYKELWGRGVLRTIQEELLELIIVKYDVPFFYIFITRFQHFSAAVYILKKLTVFAFLQTKSLCILLKETQKGKKAASRWSGGEGGGRKARKMLTRTALLLPSNSKPKLLFFQRALWACDTLSHGPELGTPQRWGENVWDRELYLGVSITLLVESITLLIVFMSTESDLKAVTLEKWTSACLGGDVCEWRWPVSVFIPTLVAAGRCGWNLAWWMRT